MAEHNPADPAVSPGVVAADQTDRQVAGPGAPDSTGATMTGSTPISTGAAGAGRITTGRITTGRIGRGRIRTGPSSPQLGSAGAEADPGDPDFTTDPDPAIATATDPGSDFSTATDPDSEADDDSPPTGPRRVLIALYAVFALAATARGVVQIATKFDEAPVAYLLSLLSGVVYIAATIGLVTNRRWSRPLAWAAVGTEMVGVVTVGLASIFDSAAFPHDTVWSRFGAGYGYVPIILPVLGLMWLWQSRGHAGRQSDT